VEKSFARRVAFGAVVEWIIRFGETEQRIDAIDADFPRNGIDIFPLVIQDFIRHQIHQCRCVKDAAVNVDLALYRKQRIEPFRIPKISIQKGLKIAIQCAISANRQHIRVGHPQREFHATERDFVFGERPRR
jgi:hypothetical protein